MNARSIWLRIRALMFRRTVDRELEEELSFHLEMASRKQLAAGLPEPEARRRARIRFGPKPLIEDQCRDARGIGLLETLAQDVRYALGTFRRSPAIPVTVIVTVGLALGLNAAVFTVFSAYVLRPAPVRDPYSLYEFGWRDRIGQFHGFSRDEYVEFTRANQVFSASFAARKQLVARIDARPAFGMLVTGEYFTVLGVDAALGRTLVASDDRDELSVVVLSSTFWRTHFAADPLIVGETIAIQGHPCEVVGVLPDGFGGLDLLPHDFWAPLSIERQLDDRAGALQIVGRLKPDITPKAGAAALTLWARAMTAARPDDEKAETAVLESRATAIPRSPLTAALFGPILSAFALVLLIACANVANMMLAAAMARQREIGIRISLGATRTRVVRQLLTESLLLAIPTALLGILIANWAVDIGTRALVKSIPPEYFEYLRLPSFAVDARVVAFLIVAAAGAAFAFGLLPALEVTRPALVRAARGEFKYNVRQQKSRNTLVFVQIAASATLLICAALLLRSSDRLANAHTGLRTRDVVEIYIRENWRPRILQTLESLPVQHVGAMSSVPLDTNPPRVSIAATGDSRVIQAALRFVTPEVFATFDIPLVNGRHFTPGETPTTAPVAIVSETLARRLWTNGDAVGRTLTIVPNERTRGRAQIRHSTVEVIGVCRDIATGYLENVSDRTQIYLPTGLQAAGTVLVARVKGDVETARQNVDRALEAAAPGGVERIHSMQALAVGRVFPLRLAYWTSVVVGAFGMLLTISGVYGLLAYTVAQRAKEIGVRMALGASVRAIVALVVEQSVRLAVMGLIAGTLIAGAASRLIGARLLRVTFDAVPVIAALIVVFAACLVATFVPARRAARLDPLTTLRHD
jgi:predicted permease